MFCYQCQETAGCTGCTHSGVCGKTPDVAAMQDLLVYVTRGISAVTGIPVDTASVARMKHTETQTRKSSYERWENVDGIFCLRRADAFAGKHVLIIDDVLTTGATTTACADALKEVEGVRISVLTLAVAAS